jgi:hypothetical protein
MSGEIKWKEPKNKYPEITFTQTRGFNGDDMTLLRGRTPDGQEESVFYRSGSIISKKFAVWRIRKLLRCY